MTFEIDVRRFTVVVAGVATLGLAVFGGRLLMMSGGLLSAAPPDAEGGQIQPVEFVSEGVMFGLGPTADAALASPLARDAPLGMLTTWFNESSDLTWLRGWQDDLIRETDADGYVHHVVVYSSYESGITDTRYGPACGLTYPLSDKLLEDMEQLAQIFAHARTLYVTMFTELQTYPCVHNQWDGSENYYRALKDQYLAAMNIFHRTHPNAKVGLGWGGWQVRWDEPSVGGGRSLIAHFADVLKRADYQAFQAMETDGSNVTVIRQMTRLLGTYGPVMVAHYLPDDASAATFDRDTSALFTDAIMQELVEHGLFAFSFMDPALFSDPSRRETIAQAITRYAASEESLPPAGEQDRAPAEVPRPPLSEPC